MKSKWFLIVKWEVIVMLGLDAGSKYPGKLCSSNFFKVLWNDFLEYIEIKTPKEYSFQQCLVYLNRSDLESVHQIKDGEFYKLLRFDQIKLVIKISSENNKLKVAFLNLRPPKWVRAEVANFVWNMFDLGTDLTGFYRLAQDDLIVKALIDKYKGLRILKMNDLFETISWAIIGQQINLKFAYTLKKRLVEIYGEKISYQDDDYYLFPLPEVIAQLGVADLKQLQLTTRKAEYIIGVAKLFQSEVIRNQELAQEQEYEKLKQKLMLIRGVGNWTADYTILKCYQINDAFPIADVGLQNALKNILGLAEKPTIPEIEKLAKNWHGWEAYVTFYLWRSLYD